MVIWINTFISLLWGCSLISRERDITFSLPFGVQDSQCHFQDFRCHFEHWPKVIKLNTQQLNAQGMTEGSLREIRASHLYCCVGFSFQMAFPAKSKEFYLTRIIIRGREKYVIKKKKEMKSADHLSDLEWRKRTNWKSEKIATSHNSTWRHRAAWNVGLTGWASWNTSSGICYQMITGSS